MFSTFATLFLLAVPNVAADTAVVPPLVGKTGVDSLQVLNITSLISSEIDFMMIYDNVTQLDTAPAGLNVGCLSSTSCLSGIAKANGAQIVYAGSVAKTDEQYEVFLVHYDQTKNKIVRKQTWKVASDPASVATRMSAICREIVTGETAAQVAEASNLGDFDEPSFTADDDDFSFDDEDIGGNRTVSVPKSNGRELVDLDLDEEDESAAAAEALKLEAARRMAEKEEKERAAKEAAEREERARAAKEAAEREAREIAAREKAEREAREKAERERAAKEAAEREARALVAREKAEREAREKAEREAKEKAAVKPPIEEDDDEIVFDLGSDDIEITIDSGTMTIEPADEDDETVPGRFEYDDEDDFIADSSSKTKISYDDLDDFDLDEPKSNTSDYDDFDLDLDTDEDEQRAAREKAAKEEAAREAREKAAREKAAREKAAREKEERSSKYDLDDDGPRGTKVYSSIYDESGSRDVAFVARFGTCGYQMLQFITYGAEGLFPVGDKAAIALGVEGHSVKRVFPEGGQGQEIGEDLQGTYTWEHMMPFHLGIRLQPGTDLVRPYLGADVSTMLYTQIESQSKFAVGARARTGLDLMFSNHVGLNANVSAGVLYGSEFHTIEEDMQDMGFVWQLSAGTVFML